MGRYIVIELESDVSHASANILVDDLADSDRDGIVREVTFKEDDGFGRLVPWETDGVKA